LKHNNEIVSISNDNQPKNGNKDMYYSDFEHSDKEIPTDQGYNRNHKYP